MDMIATNIGCVVLALLLTVYASAMLSMLIENKRYVCFDSGNSLEKQQKYAFSDSRENFLICMLCVFPVNVNAFPALSNYIIKALRKQGQVQYSKTISGTCNNAQSGAIRCEKRKIVT